MCICQVVLKLSVFLQREACIEGDICLRKQLGGWLSFMQAGGL